MEICYKFGNNFMQGKVIHCVLFGAGGWVACLKLLIGGIHL